MTNVALIFPGQGSQSVGMGKEFYDSSTASRAIFDKADSIISGLTDVIFNGPQEKLTSTAFCQPAIFAVSIAALKAFQSHPKFQAISPKYVCGLSLGEYSALAASGALSFEEVLRLIERRAFYMEEAAQLKKGSMAAVIGFDKERLIEICSQTGAEVANFNSPEQIVITGEAEKVEEASQIIKEQGAKRVIPLDVSGAFHSSLMRPAVPKFEKELEKFVFKQPIFPLISNVNARQAGNPADICKNLAGQITSSVQWVASIEYIINQGVSEFIEIGQGNILKGLLRKINPNLKVYNLRRPQDIDALPF